MKIRLLIGVTLSLVVLLDASTSQAQDLGEAYQTALDYIREMKTNTRSISSPIESPSGESSRDRGGERREKRERQQLQEQRARERIEANLARLDAWLARAASVPPTAPPGTSAKPPSAVVDRRLRQLEAVLISANHPEFEVEMSGTTKAGADVDNRVRAFRGTQIRDALVSGTPVRIQVNPSNAKAYPRPWYSDADEEMVTRFDGWIRESTRGSSVDADLVRAIIWMESTHGWLDRYSPTPPKTLLPMNIHVSFWRALGVSRSDLEEPRVNIRTGVRLIEVLWKSVEQPTAEKVATLFNDLGKEAVSGYGKTVAYYYATKPWMKQRQQ